MTTTSNVQPRRRHALAGAAGALALIAALAGCAGARQAPPQPAAARPAPAVAATPASFQGGSLADTQETITSVAARVSPSVVTISTTRTAEEPGDLGDLLNDPLFRHFFGAPGMTPTPGGPRMEMGIGSGVIVSPDGYIMTNNHIVEDVEQLQVALADGRDFTARVVGRDPPSDLALLRIEATGLPALPFGDSSRLRVGDIVLAVGNPFGVGQTVTMGIVSAVGRSNMGITEFDDFIQTDASINPGNSGGPLVNLQGELVGINTAILSRTGGSQGVGFAIPSTIAWTVLTGLRERGRVVRGWLGVGIQDLTADLARCLGLDEATRGALVTEVEPGTPAEQAGLRIGDVVVSIDGKPIAGAGQLRSAVAAKETGSEARLGVLRDGRQTGLTARVGERPTPEGVASSGSAGPGGERGEQQSAVVGNSKLSGVTVAPATPEQLREAGASPQGPGVVVTTVDPASPAALAGLRPGDVIVEVNRSRVSSTQEFLRSARGAEQGVLLRVFRGGHPLYLAWR